MRLEQAGVEKEGGGQAVGPQANKLTIPLPAVIRGCALCEVWESEWSIFKASMSLKVA